ncbi:unnamed protein product [Sphagnum troendelagicum]|uniref:Uncharacterized protein n=1 Tax=Sphagnum troendelagicum TaxID=128251 RepID=A0ABP0TP32_9BRYO
MLALDCFGGRESWGHCAYFGGGLFRREGEPRALRASTEAGALVVRERRCEVCRKRGRTAPRWMRPLSVPVCCGPSFPFYDDLRYPLPTRTSSSL